MTARHANDPLRRPLPGTDLALFPLCLGTNVFGFTADETTAFRVLDTYVEAGGNVIDTADSYCCWLGTEGGESETIIGRWLASRRNRDQVIIATKVGQAPSRSNLRPATIRAAIDDSLRRLGTDYVDIYYAHEDHGDPLEPTIAAFDDLVRAGKTRYVAASNFNADRLTEALDLANESGRAPFVALSPRYNLMDRDDFERDLAGTTVGRGLGVLPWWSLACGYLTGKHRRGAAPVDTPRTAMVQDYINDRGERVLDVLRDVAVAHGVTSAAAALAWLAGRDGVVAPIASARSVDQLMDLLAMATLHLDDDEVRALDDVSTAASAVTAS
jgi:aryl-alcohol dehydrogenase-like predicted oxidoreductase